MCSHITYICVSINGYSLDLMNRDPRPKLEIRIQNSNRDTDLLFRNLDFFTENRVENLSDLIFLKSCKFQTWHALVCYNQIHGSDTRPKTNLFKEGENFWEKSSVSFAMLVKEFWQTLICQVLDFLLVFFSKDELPFLPNSWTALYLDGAAIEIF